MASGSYASKSFRTQSLEVSSPIPPRATRQLPETNGEEQSETEAQPKVPALRKTTKLLSSASQVTTERVGISGGTSTIIDDFRPHPLEPHKSWLKVFTFSMIGILLFLLIMAFVSVTTRPPSQYLNYPGGKVYDIQVGGSLAPSWRVNNPIPPKVTILPSNGPYSVLGTPSLSVDAINHVLAAYNSPAAGKGQALYDMGIRYGIDPAFALAFFMHESTFGTRGEASASLSLGNLRCIPNAECRDNYAWFSTWEDGFNAWYELIRNLYVARWGFTTIDKIIPVYAPPADNNNDDAYIASLKHSLDTWHAGGVVVS